MGLRFGVVRVRGHEGLTYQADDYGGLLNKSMAEPATAGVGEDISLFGRRHGRVLLVVFSVSCLVCVFEGGGSSG